MAHEEYNAQKSLFEAAKQKRLPHESEIKEAFEFGKTAQRFRVSGEENQSFNNNTPKHTSTIIRASRNLITNTMRLLIPQNRRWTEITFRTNKLKDLVESRLKDQLADANDIMFRHLADSSFYLATTEALYSNIFAGTMCVQIDDSLDRPLNYMAVPIDEIYFLEDFNGMVDTVFREHEMSARQIVKRWGEKNVHKDILEAIKDDKPTKIFTLKECVIPAGGKFELSYFMKNWQKLTDDETLLLNPFIVSRWEKTLGNVWGGSPVRDALPNARAENAIVRDTLKYGSFAANGLWQSNDESINLEAISGELEPGSVIPVEEPLQPLEFPGQFNLNFEMAETQARQIGHLLFDSTPPREDTLKYATAEAVIALRQEFFNQVGEPALRLSREYLQTVADQIFKRLQMRGEISIISVRELQELGIEGVNTIDDLLGVNINAAITRALESQQAQDTLNAITVVGQVFGQQEIGLRVDTDKTVPELLTSLGLSPENLRGEAQIAKLKKQIEDQNQLLAILQSQTTTGAPSPQQFAGVEQAANPPINGGLV